MTVRRTEDETAHQITLVARDPARAHLHARRLLARSSEPRTRSIALRLLGLAQYELGAVRAADRTLGEASEVADRAGLADAADQARVSRLGLLARRGGGGALGPLLDDAVRPERPAQAFALINRGVSACQLGRFEAALADFDAAMHRMGPDADARLLPGLLCNRGLALMYAGRFAESAEDLSRALALTEQHALDHLRGLTLQNLGCLAVAEGDVARAVLRFDSAEVLLPEQRRTTLRLDRADALVAAGMHREAGALLRSLPRSGGDARPDAEYATTRLIRAKLHLGRGDRTAAAAQAGEVRAAFAPDSVWAELALQIEWSARFVTGRRERPRPVPPSVGAAGTRSGAAEGPSGSGDVDAADDPARPGRSGDPLRLPEWAADLPATAGTARLLADAVATAPLGPPTLAAPRPGHARALRALAAGDRAAVRRELRRALAGSDRAPAAAGHLETAAHARASVAELARLGAEMALSCGDATEALEWLEWPERAGETAPAARRCRDAGWLRLLDRYRAAHVRAAAGDEAAGAELYDLETRLGLAQWHPGCPAPAVGAPSSGPVTHGIAAALDRRAFVRYTRLRGAPVAITLVDGRARAHPLPTAPALGDAIDTLLHAARRDVTAPGTGAGPLTAERAALVARLLVEPVADAVADRPLVIAPPPEAQALPWGLLPGLRGRPVSIVASGRAWLRCRRRRLPRTPRVLLVAGAGLPGAEAEIEALRRERPGARVLSGARAHASALVRELGRADLAHVTAHGGVPADAPMRSGISLAGGPLFAYDLERVPRPPALTVLSSCAVGRSVPSPTGVPLGLGAALLACGGGTVIASVLPVPDIGTAAAMVRLHAALRSGAPASRAVADHLAGSGFVCFGAG